MPQTVSMMRGSVGSSSILARSFLMNTVMELVSPTNSGPQAASTSCSRESTVPGLAASVARILNSFGVSYTCSPAKVARCWAISKERHPTVMVPEEGTALLGRMAARRRCASMCIISSRGSKGFTM